MSWYCAIEIEPEMYAAVDRTARKEHRCCECRSPIAKGEAYVECSGKWDGKFSVFRQHAPCCEACMFIRDMQEECVSFGGLFDGFSECWKRDLPAELRLMFAKILRRRREHRRATEKRNP